MRKTILSSFYHILLFVFIEILFVFIILHEFPEVSFFETLWIIHALYWILVFVAWILREKAKKYWQKFLATYLPIVYHIAWHIYITLFTVEYVQEHAEHNHEIFWIVLWTVILWIFIFVWEYLLHKRYHCDHFHQKAHKHCKED